jgi:hypothetical protein
VESLAIALERAGNPEKALAVLEQAGRDQSKTDASGFFWLCNQARLAEGYRRAGRVKDARPIEDRLRRLLALADPGHPILKQLNR